MRVKIPNEHIIILLLSCLLVITIYFIPSTITRIILGLPFLLFFPGYVLLAAIFVNREMNRIEVVTLSIGISIAVVALIGFALNYTNWGIRLEPVIFSVFVFIVIFSVVAMIRKTRFPERLDWFTEYYLQLPDWKVDKLGKSLSVLLILCILGTVGILGYVIIAPKVGEIFTEFYLLGITGKAEAYPNEFIMSDNHIYIVNYYGTTDFTSEWGNITIGIVNQERKEMTYSIIIKVDTEQVNINYDGTIINQLSQIKLQHGQRWQQEIGFAPKHIGDNQKVEILLFKGENTSPADSLYFWINVKESH